MEEAPKEIFLTNSDLADGWDWVDTEGISWCAEQINTTDIEYIRKDIYDELDYANRATQLKNESMQAHIKELEEFANKVGQCIKNVKNKDYDYEPSHAYDDILDAFNITFGTTALHALEKESD